MLGADEDAYQIAKEFELFIEIWPSEERNSQFEWDEDVERVHKSLPPLERNRMIVKDTDLMIACPSQRKGWRRSRLWVAIRYAMKRERASLIIIWPDGTTKRVGVQK